jgi:hypothetical protein
MKVKEEDYPDVVGCVGESHEDECGQYDEHDSTRYP